MWIKAFELLICYDERPAKYNGINKALFIFSLLSCILKSSMSTQKILTGGLE